MGTNTTESGDAPVCRERASDREIRWARIRREHLSYAINLILTLSVASLGFLATLLLSDRFGSYTQGQRDLFLWAFVFLAVSVGAGVAATICRLWDFRLTAKFVSMEEQERGPSSDELRIIEEKRGCARTLGKISWVVFLVQVSAFLLGVALAGISIFLIAEAV